MQDNDTPTDKNEFGDTNESTERDQVARLQEVIRRWALESYTDDTFPGWATLEYMNGLQSGDLTPKK